MDQQREALTERPGWVALRYFAHPHGVGFAAGIPSVNGDPAIKPDAERPYVEMCWTMSPDGKPTCEILHADEELRSKLRLIRLDFARVLEELGIITRPMAHEILGEPLIEPHALQLPTIDGRTPDLI